MDPSRVRASARVSKKNQNAAGGAFSVLQNNSTLIQAVQIKLQCARARERYRGETER